MRVALTLLFIAMAAPGLAAERIYKCEDSKGATVYQGSPCDGAPTVEVREIPQEHREGAAGGDAAARERMFRNVEASRIEYAERNCLDAANRAIFGPLNRRRAEYEDRIRRFEAAATYARNNVAGATYLQSVRTEVAGLRNAIALEQQTAETAFAAERQRCAAQRERAEAAARAKDAEKSSP